MTENVETELTQAAQNDDRAPIERIIDVLSLGKPTTSRDHTYVKGASMYFPTGKVYGGQIIAQSVIAAARTVPEGRLPNSIHGYFITAGDIEQDVLFDVENLRDGRSFSSRRVNANQRDGAILTAIASFQQEGQRGIEFADPMPTDVPNPESLDSAKKLMQPYARYSPFANYYATQSPFDIRHVNPSVMLSSTPDSATENETDADRAAGANERSGHQMVWMKADGIAHCDQTMHRALLALGCDQIMMEPIVRRSGLDFMSQGISYASIDHSMWWYRDIDMNQWHLYVQDTPTAGHGRGLGFAKVYTQNGELVAMMAQEAMIRTPNIR